MKGLLSHIVLIYHLKHRQKLIVVVNVLNKLDLCFLIKIICYRLMRTYKIRLVINRPQDVERRSINNVSTIALASFMIYIFKFHFVTLQCMFTSLHPNLICLFYRKHFYKVTYNKYVNLNQLIRR